MAIAAAYGAAYEIARHLSFPQWMITAGLRLACLFLLPLRYWPALALGEGSPLLETSLLCVSDLGIPWAISESVPMVVLWMTLMKPLRHGMTRYAVVGASGGIGEAITQLLSARGITSSRYLGAQRMQGLFTRAPPGMLRQKETPDALVVIQDDVPSVTGWRVSTSKIPTMKRGIRLQRPACDLRSELGQFVQMYGNCF